MTTYEYIKATATMVDTMDKNHITPKLFRYMEMYDTWRRLKGEGHKITWIIQYLSEQYGISRGTFRNVIRKMGENVVI